MDNYFTSNQREKRIAVYSKEPIDLHLSVGTISLRFVAEQWVSLWVSQTDEDMLRQDKRLLVRSRSKHLRVA
jgi:hypothetical protein